MWWKVCPVRDSLPTGPHRTNTAIALPTPGSTLVDAQRCGESLWGRMAKLTARLPQGTYENYFLKVDTPSHRSDLPRLRGTQAEILRLRDRAQPR